MTSKLLREDFCNPAVATMKVRRFIPFLWLFLTIYFYTEIKPINIKNWDTIYDVDIIDI